MPTLAAPPPPAKTPAKKTAAPKTPGKDRHWADKLARSGYFLAGVLLHLLVFLIVATWVIFQPPTPPADDFVKSYVPAGAPPPPPPSQPQQTMPVPTTVANPTTVITTMSPTPTAFNIPMPDINATPTLTPPVKLVTPQTNAPNNLDARLTSIKSTELEHWGRSSSNIAESNGDPHNVVARFPVYLASYANGDWGCNVVMSGGQITAGSLPNLVMKMNEWSNGNLKGAVVPTPLSIGSPELMSKMPPFVFFTGHKDFTLTQQEIDNLRSYLQDGGCIWGDNALAGSGSRFDVAFRREMKRVVPDADKNFEEVPLTHDIYTKSWYNITKVPEGMNYYAEPVEHLDIDGKVAILYTPNDYSDMFCMRILPGDTTYQPPYTTSESPLITNSTFLWNSGFFFRNFGLEGCLESQRLGMNIIGFLLVRFDKELMLAP